MEDNGAGDAPLDQLVAAGELIALRDQCAQALAGNGSGGRVLDVAALRGKAEALRNRALADDADDSYTVTREGTPIRVTRQGLRQVALDLVNSRLEAKYPQRSIAVWIIGLVLAICCFPAANETKGMDTDEAQAYYAVAGSVLLIGVIMAIGSVTGLIIVTRGNRERRRLRLHEHQWLYAELQYANDYLRERHARVERARADAWAAYSEITALLARAEATAPGT